MAKSSKVKKDYTYSVGRRKSAAARIRLFKGKGSTTVNGKAIEDYFQGKVFKDIWSKPFRVIDSKEEFFATVKVAGGGVSGQVEAVAHGLARALAKVKETYKPELKKSGLLSRDSRTRERRKAGTGGKARRKKQSPKR